MLVPSVDCKEIPMQNYFHTKYIFPRKNFSYQVSMIGHMRRHICFSVGFMMPDIKKPILTPKLRFVVEDECSPKSNLHDSWTRDNGYMVDHCDGKNDPYVISCAFRGDYQLYDVRDGLGGCQCDALCKIFQDCCPDFAERDDGDDYMVSGILESLQCISTEYSPEKSGVGFYMIADCPSKSDDDYLSRQCYLTVRPEEHLILHYVPIEIDSNIYRNIFCAKCYRADIERGKFWQIYFPTPATPKGEERCGEVFHGVKEDPTIALDTLIEACGSVGNSGPRLRGYTYGRSRMGKLCATRRSEKDGAGEETSIDATVSRLLNLFPNDSCAQAMITAIQDNAHSTTGLKFFMKVKDGFKVISDSRGICKHCDTRFLSLFSFNTDSIKPYVLSEGWQSARWAMMFAKTVTLNCSVYDDCADEDSPISKNARAIIWQTGSTISVVLLIALLVIMKRKRSFLKSESRRLQSFFIFSKILYFVCFFLSYQLRKVACKVLSALLHATLLISFAYSILLSFNISLMMWKLKNDLASLSVKNKVQKVTWKEIVYHLCAVITCVVIVAAVVVYELVVDDALFGLGKNQHCLTTTEKGQLYLIIIPTITTLVVNALFTGYSVFTLYWLMASNPLIQVGITSRVLTFLGRMISFQGIQWILGLVHYVSGNEIVGIIFDVTASFEGMVIFASLAVAESRSRET